MGRTNQPLKLLVHPALVNHPQVVALVEKGHLVHSMAELVGDLYDGIIGPNCWMMDESLIEEGLLDVFLKACRKWKKAKTTAAKQTSLLDSLPASSEESP